MQGKVLGQYGLKPAAFLIILSVITASMPSSQEIRYYMYWIMCLVALNLVLIERDLKGLQAETFRLVSAAAMSSFLIFVFCSNGLRYILPNRVTMESLVRDWGIEQQISKMNLHDGEIICVKGKSPLTFLYAPIFNRRLEAQYHYGIIEAEDDAGCMGKRMLQ